ncbi:glutathione S-transferase family protein [Thalassospira profundimaris]|uniref:Glutathione S-transferase n=1 Tax=Thalassospira profundimaris TaxID=502049 RepID=A0A367WJ15_9PROT|nr:glutathione S-transferase family protein [Thalassospira profundimaris]RCK41418.1 glutathione S-transferase [Thalassospira profundimaris]
MPITFYGHYFSSFCQKALIAFYEHGLDYTFREIDFQNDEIMQELGALWPIRKMPVIVDQNRTVIESSIIVEYVDERYHRDFRLIPQDADRAIEVRFMDRFFDHYVATPQMKLVIDAMRSEGEHDPYGVAKAKVMLETSYAWLDEKMKDRTWAIGNDFTLADCAAGPHLFYAHWSHPIDPRFENLRAYRDRLMARPSFARCIEDGRYFRPFFPLDVPHMDLD